MERSSSDAANMESSSPSSTSNGGGAGSGNVHFSSLRFLQSPVSSLLEYSGILRVRPDYTYSEAQPLVHGNTSVADNVQSPRNSEPDEGTDGGEDREVSGNSGDGAGIGNVNSNGEVSIRIIGEQDRMRVVNNGDNDVSGVELVVEESMAGADDVNGNASSSGSDSSNSRETSLLQRYDLRMIARWIEQILPFSLLLLVVFIRQHLQGFVIAIYITAVLFKSNDILRKQTALKGERKISVLVGYAAVFMLHILGIYWWNLNDELLRPLIMLPPKVTPPFWHAIFIILVNDTMMRQAAMVLKLVLLMCYKNGKGHNFRRQGQMLTLVEYTLLLYRSLLPTAVWYKFFLNKEYGSLFSSLTTGLYLTFKLTSIVEKVQSFFASLKALSKKEVHYGTYATSEQVNAAGDLCAICQEKIHSPILLCCKHIFCEDCVSEWFERERTCPLCRALVRPPDLRSFGDGSTSLFFQLFYSLPKFIISQRWRRETRRDDCQVSKPLHLYRFHGRFGEIAVGGGRFLDIPYSLRSVSNCLIHFRFLVRAHQLPQMTSAVSTSKGLLPLAGFGVYEPMGRNSSPLVQPEPEFSDSDEAKLYSVSWNQDYSCFAAGTNNGFRIYNCNPFKETFRRNLKNGGFKIVEMLFRCNILALVGSKSNSQYPPNKVIIWDDHQSRCIGEFSFRSEVRAVKLRRDRVVIVLEHKIYVYNFMDLRLLHQIETLTNQRGLCCLSHHLNTSVLACPGLRRGQVRVEHFGLNVTKLINVHDSKIACLTLTMDGLLLATASVRGTLIRIFNTMDGTRLQEVRRGVDRADIYSIALSPNVQWLAVSSDKGTVHIFSLRVRVVGEDSSTDSTAAKSPQLLHQNSSNALDPLISPSTGANPGSSFSFMKGVLPKYFSSEWSFAQFHLPDTTQFIAAFGSQNTIAIVGMDGSFYRCSYDPVNGGPMVQQEYIRFLKTETRPR
ncbi:uncharacterized protein LOC127245063 [Andrographis paniculata]|uniref:uncharacterized protein LOC127245063 n=1 Tax=Andrographis paniculata TaxID=175694 RepID=UPI0021E72148|nr:uncharacterized protein LOC127245063 [Andrographis paniculata]